MCLFGMKACSHTNPFVDMVKKPWRGQYEHVGAITVVEIHLEFRRRRAQVNKDSEEPSKTSAVPEEFTDLNSLTENIRTRRITWDLLTGGWRVRRCFSS